MNLLTLLRTNKYTRKTEGEAVGGDDYLDLESIKEL